MPRLKLLLDVSCLGYSALGPQHRTGLLQVAAAYAEELRRHPGLELGLYSSSGNRLLAARFLKAAGWYHQSWVGSRFAAFLCFGTRSLEFAVYRSPLQFATPLFSGLRAVAEGLRSLTDRKALLRWDAYLSPMEAVPTTVRRVPGLIAALVVHDLIPQVLPEYRQDPADPTRWFAELWSSFKPTDLVFTVSAATREDWLRLKPTFPARQVSVAPNAIDPTRFHPNAKTTRRPPYFLTVGTIEPRKRLDAVMAGYQAYRSAGGRTPLLVGGRDKGSILKASEGVELLGFVDDDALPGLYASCTAFLSFSEYEGFGLPILEAMACGAPAIVSHRTSHPEVAGDAGIYIEPDDTAGVAQALASMDDPAQREAAARRSLAQAAKFRWDETVAALVRRIHQEKEQP